MLDFIGSPIGDALREHGHTVYVLDNLSSGRIENFGWIPQVFEPIDITDAVELLQFVHTFQIDIICHQAAQPSLLTSVENPALDAKINILGTINVIQAAKHVDAKIIFASTSAVYYDEPAVQPYRETHSLSPSRPYGIAKMSAEFYVKTSGLPYTILRYGNVYGPRQVAVGENQLVPRALDHIYFGKTFVVNGDGWQMRDFVYVGDIAEANVKEIENNVTGIYNAGSGKAHSVNEVLTILKELTKFPGDFEHGPEKPNEPHRVWLDSMAARERLGWWAAMPLFNGLHQTVEWYKQKHGIAYYCTCGHTEDEHDQEDACKVCACSNYKHAGYRFITK